LFDIEARNVDDLALMLKVLFSQEGYNKLPPTTTDFHWKPRPFDEQVFTSTGKLRVGVWRGCSLLRPAECMSRAVEIAAQALASRGHELVEFDPSEQVIEDLL
jgi:Asp-tRNA(Asn)/Glu-tRNA(Gln) amidotransferase A subunit family amidase